MRTDHVLHASTGFPLYCTSKGISSPVWTGYFFCLQDYSAMLHSLHSKACKFILHSAKQRLDLVLKFVFKNVYVSMFYSICMCDGKNWKDDYRWFLNFSMSAFSSCSLNAPMINTFGAVVSAMHLEALGCLICPIFPQCLIVPRGPGVSGH